MLNQNTLAGISKQVAPIKQMMAAVRSAGDPNAMLQQMMATNPQMQKVQQIIQQNGGDARTAFYAVAQQQGVDPEQILAMLR